MTIDAASINIFMLASLSADIDSYFFDVNAATAKSVAQISAGTTKSTFSRLKIRSITTLTADKSISSVI